MKHFKKQNTRKKVVLFAGATALMTLVPQTRAQTSVDALLNKLEQKGILTVDEAKELKAENQQDSVADMNKAMNSRFQMPDWITGYKLYGDFRGRYDELTTSNPGNANINAQDQIRLRYRLRVGLLVNMKDNMQVGFSLGSDNSSGNDLSNNTTLENNATKKPIYIDTAFGKWTPINNESAMLAATIGKMYQPFQASWMEFDPDYTPEGAALQSTYKFNDTQSIGLNTAAFVLDNVSAASPVNASNSSRDPWLYGAQVLWNSTWTPRLASTLGFAVYNIVNKDGLGLPTGGTTGIANNPANYNPGGVANNNQGNTRNPTTGNLQYWYNPIVGSASFTYMLDSFPLYNGKFPIKPAGTYMYNPAAPGNNQGYWIGLMFGKAGKKGLWDVSYRYEYLEADAWYDELVDDDNVAFYANSGTVQPKTGWVGGTNIKGHLVRANYSLTDALTFSFTCYINQLINPNQNNPTTPAAGEPNSNALHVMADLTWKF